MAVHQELSVCRDLVNAKFDGYKLSLDQLPIYNSAIDNGIDVSKLSDDQISFHHAKLLSVHNHLVPDPWDPLSVFYISKDWSIYRATVNNGNQIDKSSTMFSLPDSANLKLKPGRFNISLCFPSPTLAAVADGCGHLFLLETGERNNTQTKWKSIYSHEVSADGKAFFLADSIFRSDTESDRVDCLLVSIEQFDMLTKTLVEWISLVSIDKKVWTLERTRLLEGEQPYDYLALDKGGNHVHICSSQRYKMVSDTVKPVEADSEEWHLLGKNDKLIHKYTWSRDDEYLEVTFSVAEGVVKADIYMSLSSEHIDMGVKNGAVLLKGPLYSKVHVEGSTWTIQEQKVILLLQQQVAADWPSIVVGDNRGQRVLNPERVAEICDGLAAFTSDQQDSGDIGEKPYNTQELEDCDVSTDSKWFFTLDGETHRVSKEVLLGTNQWLFNISLSHEKTNAICLRHDCDGALWQPEDSSETTSLKHVGMLHAFGYVQASKMQRKFSTCSPDMSYAVICDCNRHLYIYRQRMPVATPLRNRKTGEKVINVAKQQVISLDTTDDFLGLHVTDTRLFVLTGQTLFVIKSLSNPDEI